MHGKRLFFLFALLAALGGTAVGAGASARSRSKEVRYGDYAIKVPASWWTRPGAGTGGGFGRSSIAPDTWTDPRSLPPRHRRARQRPPRATSPRGRRQRRISPGWDSTRARRPRAPRSRRGPPRRIA